MPLALTIKEPILVKNPITDRFVNVAPLFDLMREIDNSSSASASDVKKAISDTIRNVIEGWDGDGPSLKSAMFNLYLLEDTFSAMSEFKSGKS